MAICKHNWRSVHHEEIDGQLYKIYHCITENKIYLRERVYDWFNAKV